MANTTQLICTKCNKTFAQRASLTRHQNAKKSCVKDDTLISVFKYCLNVLRTEHLMGIGALQALTHLLDLRLLESQFGKTIDIDNFNYDFSAYEDEDIPEHKAKLLEVVRFSNLAKEKEENLPNIMLCLWDDILSKHERTKNIFLNGKGNGFKIKQQSTYKKLINKLNEFNFESIECDILGEAYENVIKDFMTGKTLGQFFTPPMVKQQMIELINPLLKQNGTCETIFDPSMGTGGFLITSLRHFIKQSKEKNIPLDWKFISNGGVSGREAEKDTYQLAISNMLISSGHTFNLECDDSIREPITNKYDIVLANPPFGIKDLEYDTFHHSLKFEYLPIKSDNAVSLFLQAIIYMLKINGRCAVVLPDGQDLHSIDIKFLNIRKFLMKTCDLKEIIYLPSGVFTYTSIKTCIAYFVKKREGAEAVNCDVKYSKTTQQEISRKYNFVDEHQTTNVSFYNLINDKKTLLVEASIDKIVENEYSLNYNLYLEAKIEEFNKDVEIKTLGELCKFMPKSKRQASYGEEQGLYPFYTSSQTNIKYCDVYDYEEYCLIIGTGGNANIKYSKKFSCSTDNFILTLLETTTKLKYLYYYLLNNIQLLQDGFMGVAIKHISKDYLSNIKIPIPSLECQAEIVEYLNFLNKTNQTNIIKIEELKKANGYYLNNQKRFGENEIKTIDEIAEIQNGKRIIKDTSNDGEYPVLGGGGFTSFYTDKYSREGKSCKISREGMSLHNCVMILNIKYYLNSQAFTIKSIDENLKDEYLWYYLLNEKEQIFNCGRGTAQKAIDINAFKSIKILIPSIENQQKIVEYCEKNDAHIKLLEQEIEDNKQLMKDYLNNVLLEM